MQQSVVRCIKLMESGYVFWGVGQLKWRRVAIEEFRTSLDACWQPKFVLSVEQVYNAFFWRIFGALAEPVERWRVMNCKPHHVHFGIHFGNDVGIAYTASNPSGWHGSIDDHEIF